MHSPGGDERVVERWNDVFRAISVGPRRELILSLMAADYGEDVTLPESATGLCLRSEPDDLKITLRHQHLPKLADKGFIRWESDPLTVTRGPRFEEVAAVLRALDSYATELPAELVSGCPLLEARL